LRSFFGPSQENGPRARRHGLSPDYDVISQWNDPAETAGHIQWTREYWTAVEPFATGEVYVNHLDAEEATRIRAAYSGNYDRLVALKNKYDPTNLFRMNQNIRPTV
jgi:FAD/FMN-containing dehydrogenase